MANTVVQTKSTTAQPASSAAPTLAFASNNTSGNALIVTVAVQTQTVTGVSDSHGQTYTLDKSGTGGGWNLYIYRFFNCRGGACTVTVNLSAATANVKITITELAATAGMVFWGVDVTGSLTGTGTAVSCGPFTTTKPNDVIIATSMNSGPQTTTVGSGYTTLGAQWTAGNPDEYQILTATGSQTPSATLAASATWGMIAVAYAAQTPTDSGSLTATEATSTPASAPFIGVNSGALTALENSSSPPSHPTVTGTAPLPPVSQAQNQDGWPGEFSSGGW